MQANKNNTEDALDMTVGTKTSIMAEDEFPLQDSADREKNYDESGAMVLMKPQISRHEFDPADLKVQKNRLSQQQKS